MTARPGDIIKYENDDEILLYRLVTLLGGGNRMATGSGNWQAVPVREAGVDADGARVYEQIGIEIVEVVV